MAKRKAKKIVKPQGKSTAIQSQVKQNVIYKQLLQGYPRRHIIEYCSKRWGIHRAQVDIYIKKCNDAWAEASRFDRESELSKEIEKAAELVRICMKRKSYQTALSGLKHLSMLKRLNSLEIDFKGAITLENRIEGMSDDEINKIEKDLSEKLTKAGYNLKRKGKAQTSKSGGG